MNIETNTQVRIKKAVVLQFYDDPHARIDEEKYIGSMVGRVGTLVGRDAAEDYPLFVQFQDNGQVVRFAESEVERA